MGKRKKKKRNKGKASQSSSSTKAAPTRPSWFDPQSTRERVERALLAAGSLPHVVGFEAVGIQEFLAANSRPIALDGASSLIKTFDAKNLEEERTVFAGGGRGLVVVAEGDVPQAVCELEQRYRDNTLGGQLAISHVPLELEAQRASMQWLRMTLDGAKDRAGAPRVPLPSNATEICTDCKVRGVEGGGYIGPDDQVIASCKRCAKVVKVGRANNEERWTFEEISSKGPLALVYADGNNLSALFSELDSLEDQALCSQVVSELFASAHAAACPRQVPFIDPVVGGDDVRIFLPPHALIPYVTTLARRIHELTAQLDERELPRGMVRALRRLGVGVGAVVAPYHYPVHRLFHIAHELEDEAKRVCMEHGYRSALSFVCLRSGEELSQGVERYAEQGGRPNAIELGTGAADRYLARAAALLEVPSSQRAMMVSARDELADDVVFLNLFCYQLARNARWRAWFDACEVDWRDRDAVAANLPDRRLLDLASLSEVHHEGV